MPDKDTYAIVFAKIKHSKYCGIDLSVIPAFFDAYKDIWIYNECDCPLIVSHWMPLPQSPTE